MRQMLFVALFLGVSVSTHAAEQVENPMYKNWAKFPKGTSVVYKSVNEFAGQKSEGTMTTKLLEVSDEKVVVEMTIVTKIAGMEIKAPGSKQEYKKMMDLPAGTKKEDLGKIPGTVKEGTENVKVAGKEYKSKWYQTETKVGENTVAGQSWVSEEVPGSIVKFTSKTTGKFTGTSSLELVEVKKP